MFFFGLLGTILHIVAGDTVSAAKDTAYLLYICSENKVWVCLLNQSCSDSDSDFPRVHLCVTAYNFSHRIDHLSFGEEIAGIINPLDGTEKITHNSESLAVFSTDARWGELKTRQSGSRPQNIQNPVHRRINEVSIQLLNHEVESRRTLDYQCHVAVMGVFMRLKQNDWT